MKIISINPGHNATVGYFENGECKCIHHEEKFNNQKNYLGLPLESLKYLQKTIDFNAVDYFVFPAADVLYLTTDKKDGSFIENISRTNKLRKIYDYLEYKTRLKIIFTSLRNFVLFYLINPGAKKSLERFLLNEFQIPKEKLIFVDHHLCHCLSPFFFYGLADLQEDFLLMSMDGAGDFSFSKIYQYDHKKRIFKLIANSSFDASLGLFYSEVTKFLGMKPNEHEYKVMGLAAYVSNEKYYKAIYDKMAKIIWLDEKKLTFHSKFNLNVASLYLKENLFCERFDNVSAAIQKLTEDLVLRWIEVSMKKTGIKNIALSGGVFMNVKMNQKIVELSEIKKVYFQPSCGDDSAIIGAVAKVFLDKKVPLKPINTMYLGHYYSNSEVAEFFQKTEQAEKYKIEYFEDIEKKIAEMLASSIIIARFKGACEWGARSLCNRAILGNAKDLKTFFEVNDLIKMRDFWMPFAPTISEDWAGRYVKNWDKIKTKTYDSTKYMIMTMESTTLAQEHLRAAIHQKDKTLRPQVVSAIDNPELHKLLKYYEQLTGMGGIMNTSLNIHGYPLVATLEQVVFTMENSGLKYIAVENYLVSKR
ncbi:MAG: carbamoyltransferase C-terminal domain-containing protein [Candidatus Moraniibacteriota bacterium]